MKITRNKVQGSLDTNIVDKSVCEDNNLCDELGIVDSPQVQAKQLIRQAIDKLAEVAKDDEVAKSAIADLSVVLFEL